MSEVLILDLREPLELAGGDLAPEGGIARVMARALRLLFMRPGELLHRPDYGADLGRYANKPATPGAIQEIENAIARGLALMPEIKEWSAEIKSGQWLELSLSITVNGASLTQRGIRI